MTEHWRWPGDDDTGGGELTLAMLHDLVGVTETVDHDEDLESVVQWSVWTQAMAGAAHPAYDLPPALVRERLAPGPAVPVETAQLLLFEVLGARVVED